MNLFDLLHDLYYELGFYKTCSYLCLVYTSSCNLVGMIMQFVYLGLTYCLI